MAGNRSEDGDQTPELNSLLKEFPASTNVLAVDTNLITLLNMKKIIKQYGYQATVYSAAEEALSFLKNCKHDINIVIWDFDMPGINGLEALQIIGSEMNLPVVIMSDDNPTESVMQATIHGACFFVMKPVKEEVIAIIWKHIVRKRMMSKPGLIPPVQLDPVPNDGFKQDKHDSKISNKDQGCIKKLDPVRLRYPHMLNDGRNLGHSNDGFKQDKDDPKITDQENGEQSIDMREEKAAKKPRIGETQPFQSDLVQTNGVDQDNDDSKTINQHNGEENLDKEKPKKSRMKWSRDLEKKFLKAIDILGGPDKATPKTVHECLQDMKIEGLTRSNVSSHLQKHRISLEEKQIRQQTPVIDWSTTYTPPSLFGPNNVHTASSSSLFGPNNDHAASSSLFGLNNVHIASSSSLFVLDNVQIAPSSSLFGPNNDYTASSSSLFGLNNVHMASSSSLLGPSNVHTASSSLTNGRAINPIQQNQYRNAYLTMNNNKFMTNPLPRLSNFDDHFPQEQFQQQYHSAL